MLFLNKKDYHMLFLFFLIFSSYHLCCMELSEMTISPGVASKEVPLLNFSPEKESCPACGPNAKFERLASHIVQTHRDNLLNEGKMIKYVRTHTGVSYNIFSHSLLGVYAICDLCPVYPLICARADGKFLQFMKSHTLECHSGSVECWFACNEKLKSDLALIKHLNKEHESDLLKIIPMGLELKDYKKGLYTLKRDGKYLVKCQYCDKTQVSNSKQGGAQELRSHMKEAHPEILEHFECGLPQCSKSFGSSREKYAHFNKEHQEELKMYACAYLSSEYQTTKFRGATSFVLPIINTWVSVCGACNFVKAADQKKTVNALMKKHSCPQPGLACVPFVPYN